MEIWKLKNEKYGKNEKNRNKNMKNKNTKIKK